MKVIGLNQREYNLNLNNFIVRPNDSKKKSQYHLQARELLNEMFKGYSVLEEVKMPGSRCPAKKSVLFMDFFIPTMSLAVEVHGKQHYEFCPFFHKSKIGFVYAQQRDRIKQDWCNLNNIQLVALKYSDSVETWRKQIESR